MTPENNRRACSRVVSDRETHLADAQYSDMDLAVLALSRFYFQTFAAPTSQAWLRAMQAAAQIFGPEHGPVVAQAVLTMVQAMRQSRESLFRFSTADCPGCARILCDTERLLMASLIDLRKGRTSAAHTHAMLLCEGNETAGFLIACDALNARIATATGQDETQKRARPRWARPSV